MDVVVHETGGLPQQTSCYCVFIDLTTSMDECFHEIWYVGKKGMLDPKIVSNLLSS